MKRPDRKYFLVVLGMLFIFIPCSFLIYPFFPNTDGCEHAAAVKELTYSFTKPQNPMLDLSGRTSPRFVPSILMIAMAKKMFSIELFPLLSLSSIASFIILCLGIYLFSKEYFQDERQPLYTLLCILFLWGTGWLESNSYMFSSLIPFAYYPSVISFSFIPLSLFFLLRYVKNRKQRHSTAFVFLSTFILLNHPVTGFLYFFVVLLLIATERCGRKRNFLLWIVSFLIALGITGLWPYYPFFKSLTYIASGKAQQFWDYRITHAYLYSDLLRRIGPALLGIIALLYFGFKRKHLFMVLGFFSCLLFYAIGYFFDINLCERFIFFCLFFSQLAFSRFFKMSIEERASFKNPLVATITTIFFLCALAGGIGNQLFMTRKIYLPLLLKKSPHPMEKYFVLQKYLHRGDTVLADVFTSWPLPCITDVKVISLYHNSPLIPENAERVADTVNFFQSPEERTRIVKKYHISHVLLNKKLFPPGRVEDQVPQFFIPYPDEHLISTIASLGITVLNNENFFLVKVKRDLD